MAWTNAPVATPRLLELCHVAEERGALTVADSESGVPFAIARAYWVTDVPDSGRRGEHAHREVWELLVAVPGSFVVDCDTGHGPVAMRLSRPDRGLLLAPLTWRALRDFSGDAVCLVLASGPYIHEEYVDDHGEWTRLVGAR